MSAAGKAARRWLLLGHRWLGIVTGLFFALWIGSGLVMLYVPFPGTTKGERLADLAPLAWNGVRLGPDVALAAAGDPRTVASVTLEMRDGAPVYRVATFGGGRLTISAMSGDRMPSIGADAALRIAGGRRTETVWRDQWTVTARYEPLRPFHKVALDDEAGTERYVSAVTGEVALRTTRRERAWNWVGAVTHWVYLTPLRARPELWRQVVLWLSGVAAVTATTGVGIGLWRIRLRRRYRGGAVSPYRGLALWHHGLGLLGGIGLVTFIVSGWLSMNPNRWFSSSSPPEAVRVAYAAPPGHIGLTPDALATLGDAETRSMQFTAIGGRWWIVRDGQDTARAISAVTERQTTRDQTGSRRSEQAELDDATIAVAAAHVLATGALAGVERIDTYDAYWYPHGDERPLPVLRLVYDDPASTWLHVDPRDGAILQRLDRSGRINRWLFDAPHRLDLPGLVTRPALRDGAQWVLNILGAGIALTGLAAGARRLIRGASTARR